MDPNLTRQSSVQSSNGYPAQDGSSVQLVNHRMGGQAMHNGMNRSLSGVPSNDMMIRPEAQQMIQDQSHLSAMSAANPMLASLAPSAQLPG